LAFLWLDRRDIDLFHGHLLQRYGGLGGAPDEGAVESTLARPLNLLAYEPNSTIFDLAASYGYGFARNHCFPDGNKRVALAAMDVFLMINGFDLNADEAEAVVILNAVAAGSTSQEELSAWLAARSSQLAKGEI
jgi:death-on-curing protein